MCAHEFTVTLGLERGYTPPVVRVGSNARGHPVGAASHPEEEVSLLGRHSSRAPREHSIVRAREAASGRRPIWKMLVGIATIFVVGLVYSPRIHYFDTVATPHDTIAYVGARIRRRLHGLQGSGEAGSGEIENS